MARPVLRALWVVAKDCYSTVHISLIPTVVTMHPTFELDSSILEPDS